MAKGSEIVPTKTTTLAAQTAQSQAGAVLMRSTYLRFYSLFHPHVCEMVRRLNAEGIAGLLDRDLQERSNDFVLNLGQGWVTSTMFEQQTQYEPSEYVHEVYPRENVDFDGGAYSVYNWETFFHIPLLIADRLSKDQQFQAAQNWLHFIFNPTVSSTIDPPMRYWNTLPFFQNTHPEKQQIVALLMSLKSKGADPGTRDQVRLQIEQWRDNPFKPHLIARLRITAYQKTVVMKYIDNLVNWGDWLFRQETIESINEATQLYVLAYKILGPRPQEIPQRVKKDSEKNEQSYHDLRPYLDEFSNALVVLENEFPFASDDVGLSNGDGSLGADGLGTAQQFYFCIPPNEKLLAYWDTVEDRLFKIRHCMNIEGVVRQLPLFEPPIDPALLVRATAMGLDLNSVLNDLSVPLSPYRFQALAQKAVELCGELKALGGALLSALEKKGAEEIARLRADHEVTLLKAMRDIKSGKIQEARRSKAALQKSWDGAEARRAFYQSNLDNGLNFYEQDHLSRLQAAKDKQSQALTYELQAQDASQLPNATFGNSGYSSPVVTAQFGGSNLSTALSAYARHLGGEASTETYKATNSSIMGSHKRREDDWRQQLTLAEKELTHIQAQMDVADVGIAIAEWDLRNHDRQTEQSTEIQEFFQNKYTQTELYSWMVGQVSSVFFQTYKLAYDMAKQAERAYRFERGLTSSNLIQFGHWDSMRKGLLSGERLALDIKRMEAAYMAEHRREYEIVKSVSLAATDPLALITLRETGRCDFELTEARFDFDFPGHYMRRIKAMSVTIPCVTGPYIGVNATLTLQSNRIRIDPNAQRPYTPDDFEDARFVFNFASQQSIATSHAQNDSGMFELNFRDERYLPFEGAGAVSRWRLDMPRACNAFDFNTISDAIVRISYTAREGGELLRAKAMESALLPGEPVIPGPPLKQTSPPILNMPDQPAVTRFFSARQEFSNEWHRFLHPVDTATAHTLTLHIDSERFPLQFQNKHIDLVAFEVFLKLKGSVQLDDKLPFVLGHIQVDGEPDDQSQLDCSFGDLVSPVPGLAYAIGFNEAAAAQPLGRWDIVVEEADLQNIAQPLVNTVLINGQTHTRLNPDAVYDLLVLCRYATSEPLP